MPDCARRRTTASEQQGCSSARGPILLDRQADLQTLQLAGCSSPPQDHLRYSLLIETAQNRRPLGHGLINEAEMVGENLVAEKAQDRRKPVWFSRSWNVLRGQIRPILRTFAWLQSAVSRTSTRG